MKNIVKYGLVGLAGYLIGFYEMKYRTVTMLLKAKLREEESENEESQVE